LFGPDVGGRLSEEESTVLLSLLSIDNNSRATIETAEFDSHEPKVRFVLTDGRAYARVIKMPETGTYEFVTPAAQAFARGTAFLVTYNPDDEVTEVLGASGIVQVVGHTGVVRSVSPHWKTRVKKGQEAEPPVRVPDEQFRQAIEGLEFIGGGRAQSLAVGDPLRKGTKVPKQYRFALGVGPPPDTVEACPHTSAPTCIPPEPVGGLGNLDLEF
jgi:hypothetical protein